MSTTTRPKIRTVKQGRVIGQAWTLGNDGKPDGRWAVERMEDDGTLWYLIANPTRRDGYLMLSAGYATLEHAVDAIADGTAADLAHTEATAIAQDVTRTDAERGRAQAALLLLDA